MHSTFQNIQTNKLFQPSSNWLQIQTIDMHTGGEPLRVILDGFPEIKGKNVLAYRNYCKDNFDHLRKALMFEPRGHADMYGCILVPPNDEEGNFGILFMHNEGYSTMCGHAIIAISTLAVDMQWIPKNEGINILKIDAPCGRIKSFVEVKNDKVKSVKFHCVPSFVVELDAHVEIPGLGKVVYDLAYGGAFYAYVDLEKNNLKLKLSHDDYRKLIEVGMKIKQAVIQTNSNIIHPDSDDLSFLYGTIFTGPSSNPKIDSRNVCIFADGEVDRCPTGSGVSGRMAIHHAKKEIRIGETMSIESITDSVFWGSVVREVVCGDHKAIIPQVEGTAHITGMHKFIFDPNDPIKEGFILR